MILRYAGRLRSKHPNLANVAEGVLGYGLFPGSEICQRHAYWICFIWVVEMLHRSTAIVAAMEERHPIIKEWREARRALEPPPDGLDPTAQIRYGQARLFANSMYSDDGFKIILGVELTVLALTVEIEIMTEKAVVYVIMMLPRCCLGQY